MSFARPCNPGNSASRSTPYQWLCTRVSFDRLGLSIDRFTAEHGVVFEQAGLPVPKVGTDIHNHLRNLTRRQSADLLRALEARDDAAEEGKS